MRTVRLTSETDFAAWREVARGLVLAGEGPAAVRFRVGADQGSLFDAVPRAQPAPPTALLSVPRAFLDLGAEVVLHRSEDRFDLLYRLLWRLQSERDLIKVTSDRDVADALERAKNVSRASHKMKAFVRFRQAEDDAGERWISWFEPAHRVLEKTAPFFQRRFTTMRWTILTPDGTADWDGEALSFGPPATRDMAPQEDEIEEFWKTYYASTFNPARLKTKTMQGEMPKRYWANLPEAALIPELVARAEVREREMVAAPATPANPKLVRAVAPVVERAAQDAPPPDTLEALERAVQGCRRCPLWRDATQGVCGRGPARADLMIVGEQPGDQEDLSGEPFVGPAGQVLNAAMAEAGVDRSDAFVTNAVKHFKHEPRGKRRLHKTPDAGEISACRWWLDAERAIVKPKLIVTLGATAAYAVLGRKAAVTQERGRPIALEDGSSVLLTVHPSYLLRIPDKAAAAAESARFVADLRTARALL
ncbi:MAG: UdgX family uracil-DNA binding protein [Alphaproteobacteria bacterium]|nr:UdgX family uracil-DNA binding protein [Alphaproteobacteria bacterium]MBU1524797.1 UdgX family uracil-DNA binding protein [Alphaproteobacteria bacterium]MBU2351081.1 UdgX family uracil-DNA binding protein [Alphaproteobacteria bacterium]MBU2382023.1 UdgX family uracil-DNA binding protein [Alphaproteobacteria bacterium]